MKRLKAIKEAHAGQPQKGSAPPPPPPPPLASPPPPSAIDDTAMGEHGAPPAPAGGDSADQRASLLAAQAHVAAAWSDPFLRSVLQVVRNSRRTLMAKLKFAELVSRERAAQDLGVVVEDVCAEDLAATVLRRASHSGLA